MENNPSLEVSSQIRCPHCRHWHPVIKGHPEGTDYAVAMLYWECGAGRYYAGQVGGTSRFPIRSHKDEISV